MATNVGDGRERFTEVKERPVRKKKEKGAPIVEYETMKEFIYEKVSDFLKDYIPDEVKDLPEPYMTRLGILCVLGFLGTFFFFAIIQYSEGKATSYISLVETSNCKKVARSITSSYLGSSLGYWQGHEGFSNKDISYDLTLTNFNGTSKDYKNMMESFQKELIKYSNIGDNQLTTYQVLLWTSFYAAWAKNDDSAVQVLRLAGEVDAIFKPLVAYGSFANHKGVCSLTYPTFEQGMYTFSWKFTSPPTPDNLSLNGVNCTDFIYISDRVSNTSEFTSPNFELSMDMNSFVTALAVNMGVLPFSALQLVYRNIFNYTYKYVDGEAYYLIGSYMYDPKYPGMEPILCIDPASHPYNKSVCAVAFELQYMALPSFFPVGPVNGDYAYTNPPNASNMCPPCNAQKTGNQAKVDKYCNTFNFFASLIVFPVSINKFYNSSAKVSNPFVETVIKFDFNMQVLQNATYNATYGAALGNFADYNKTTKKYMNDRQYLDNETIKYLGTAFEFCNNSCYALALASIPFYATASDNVQLINSAFKTINQSNCDSQIIYPIKFSNLIEKEPSVLVEDYYECHYTTQQLFLDSVGIANGNTAALLPLFVSSILPFIYLYLKCIGRAPPKKEYSKDDEEVALKFLAIQLLRARDGKTRSIKKNGAIISLANELLKSAKNIPGYPDSDDEDDEDDVDSDEFNFGDHESATGKKVGKIVVNATPNTTSSTSSSTSTMRSSSNNNSNNSSQPKKVESVREISMVDLSSTAKKSKNTIDASQVRNPMTSSLIYKTNSINSSKTTSGANSSNDGISSNSSNSISSNNNSNLTNTDSINNNKKGQFIREDSDDDDDEV